MTPIHYKPALYEFDVIYGRKNKKIPSKLIDAEGSYESFRVHRVIGSGTVGAWIRKDKINY